jgi:hypothetical protein
MTGNHTRTTIELSGEIEKKLLLVAQLSGLSVDQLAREFVEDGAENYIHNRAIVVSPEAMMDIEKSLENPPKISQANLEAKKLYDEKVKDSLGF